VSTFDHLSRGCVGWNIVTSVSNNAARNFGFDRIVSHDERYAWAAEYMDVVYKLWEGSWEEGAVLREANPGKEARVRDLGHALSYNTRIVGTPEQIADSLEEWRDAGIDGVNLICQISPKTYVDFIDQVVPVLQRRGLAQRGYAPGTLRERLFPGHGPRLPERHPSARFRLRAKPQSSAASP
jgi:alkanesulfonate monooxygenase SsuD/methylene tetrahydromethanopterin reductase-like flavin-dependent oxidoreductase (luciferase family)